MNNRVLYIDNRRVDLPDSVNFNLVWQCGEPGELKIYGSGSSTIKLPFTPTNDAVFGNCKYLTAVGGREFQTFVGCRYYERGILMIDEGKAYITAISGSYEICLTWGNSDYVQRLKDISVADLGGNTFRWNNNPQYPYLETCDMSENYGALYLDGTNERFRYALSRPIYRYQDILNTVGITKSNCPQRIWNGIYTLRLQVNSLQAKGKLVIPLRVENFDFSDWESVLCTTNLMQTIEIETAGEYSLQIGNMWQIYTLYYREDDGKFKEILFPYSGNLSLCFYLTTEGQLNVIGRNGGWRKAFVQDGTECVYAPMYRAVGGAEGATGSVSDTQLKKPLFVGYSDNSAELILCHTPDNPEEQKVYLAKGTYYLMAVMASSLSTDYDDFPPALTEQERKKIEVTGQGSSGSFMVNNERSLNTKIDTPASEVLYTNPPKVVQMLGYSTAYDIVADFMRMFPLMIIERGGEPYYFDLTTVLSNKPTAYDWSPYFVRLDKIEIGNSKVGSDNEVRFTDYEGFTGRRSNGIFSTVAGKGRDGDYMQFSQITSYDTLTSFNGKEIPYFPMIQAVYNDKTDSYSAKFQDRPNLLLNVRGGASYSIMGSDGKYYNLLGCNSEEDTLQYIIDTYWRDFIRIVGTQKTVTVTLNLNPYELHDFDFRRPVYLKQLSVYVFAQKITYKGGMVAELQGIVLPTTSQGTPQPVEDGMLVDADDVYLVDSADIYLTDNN